MAEALEGLPSVSEVDVDLSRDRFTVTYRPAVESVANLLDAVKSAGYEPRIVTATPATATVIDRLEPASLPAVFGDALRDAARAEQLVLVAFSGPG